MLFVMTCVRMLCIKLSVFLVGVDSTKAALNGQVVWGSVCGVAGAIPDHCGEQIDLTSLFAF